MPEIRWFVESVAQGANVEASHAYRRTRQRRSRVVTRRGPIGRERRLVAGRRGPSLHADEQHCVRARGCAIHARAASGPVRRRFVHEGKDTIRAVHLVLRQSLDVHAAFWVLPSAAKRTWHLSVQLNVAKVEQTDHFVGVAPLVW